MEKKQLLKQAYDEELSNISSSKVKASSQLKLTQAVINAHREAQLQQNDNEETKRKQKIQEITEDNIEENINRVNLDNGNCYNFFQE